jgi:glyoxylase-like metal-dependent hydrolase (beta-lactamase superfamily II)
MFVPCYVIVHPRGTLIWGTGLSQALLEKPEGVVIPNGALRIFVKRSLADQLKSIGLEPKDFTYVSMSHLHGDHAGNANLFAGTTWIVQQEEYDAAFGPDPQTYGFNPDLVAKLKDGPVLKLQGDYDLFSDGSVVILRSPGHTPGHQSLFVDLPKTGPIVLSGDLWHFAGNRAAKRVPSFNFSAEQTRASMEKIEQFVSGHHATVWIEHDWDQNAQLRGAPNLYD